MLAKGLPTIALVLRETRMEGLLKAHGTRGQVRWAMKQAAMVEAARLEPATVQSARVAAAPDALVDLDEEDQNYQEAVGEIRKELDLGLPVQVVPRDFVPNFDFALCEVVVVIGQDGLVANVAKYVGAVPIVAVNPDPRRIDGILLPFQVRQARTAVNRVLQNRAVLREVTLARIQLNNGQEMLAFNDFFIGCSSHASARYRLRWGGREEPQSSSGILISTGAGSTGWLSSVFNMASGIANWLDSPPPQRLSLKWEDRKLLWAVREPFVSKHSEAGLVAGTLLEHEELVVESTMSGNGVIFSDGIENDFLAFNGGTIARVSIAEQRARLVVG